MLPLTTLLVHSYEAAIAFYVDAVGFELVEDTDLGDGKRWVVVRPRGARESSLLLAEASTPEQTARVGDQTGGRVSLLLTTDDFVADHARMTAAGVRFLEEPRTEPFGTVAVFADLYGTTWDLIQPA